jgi:glycosyltransferase involved in cell wall biosynthesis
MNVTIALEHHFLRTPDGCVWTQTTFAYQFWQRYLQVFDSVRVIARVRNVDTAMAGCKQASGPAVTFIDIPDYLGPYQYLACWPRIRSVLREQARHSQAVILRLGSSLGSAFVDHFRRGQPFGVEVVADPYDVFQRGSVIHSLRPLFRVWFTADLKRLCGTACAAAYVTRYALQARYPCPSFSTSCSDVEIGSDALVLSPRDGTVPRPEPPRLICIGTLAQMYKGLDVLLRAAATCVDQGFRLSLTVVGDGRYRPELEHLAATLGLQECVHFVGQLPAGPAVRDALDAADLFVMPSRQEGLPRAMVEAMARALPCIGSNIGGIPELLSPDNIVPVGDEAALAHTIMSVLRDPKRMARMSAENLARAYEFREELLLESRTEFLELVRDRTAEWMRHSRQESRHDTAAHFAK